MVFGALFINAHCFCQYNEGRVPHFLEELFVLSAARSKGKKWKQKDLQKGSDLQNPLFLREAIKMEIWACIKIQSRIMTELMEAALTSVICKRDQTHLSVRTT